MTASDRMWRALGFPDVEDDTVMFTDGDVAALRDVRLLADDLGVPVELSISIARTMAQSAARLAATEVAAMGRISRDRMAAGAAPEQVLDLAEKSVEVLERLLAHVWRRHLAASAARLLELASVEDAGAVDRPVTAVGSPTWWGSPP